MRYVYLLSDYDEYGAENVVATLDRSRLPEMLKRTLPRYMLDAKDNPEAALAALLAKPDAELTRLGERSRAGYEGFGALPHSLTSGWGGPQLHVVPLEEVA